jgi:hypothetical protein
MTNLINESIIYKNFVFVTLLAVNFMNATTCLKKIQKTMMMHDLKPTLLKLLTIFFDTLIWVLLNMS